MAKRKTGAQSSGKQPLARGAVTPHAAPAPSPVSGKRFWIFALVGALLLWLVTYAIYKPALPGPFIFDDDPKIVRNPDIKDWNHIWSKLVYPYDESKSFVRNDPSRPLVYLTFAWNYHLGKLNPSGYRLFNVFMHFLNVLLIWAVTRTLWWFAFKRWENLFPAIAAAFFAVHPLNTSTVSYVFSRSDLLALFFYLLALWLFAYAFRTEKKNVPLVLASLCCFIPAFYAKQLAATLPAVLLLFDYVFLSNFNAREMRTRLWVHLPYWGLLALFLIGRVVYFGALGDLEAKTPLPAGPYAMTQAYAIVRYLLMLLVPVGLSIDHAVGVSKDFFEPKILLSWLVIIGIFAGLVSAFRKRTDAAKLVVFFLGFFIITMAPTSSFLPTTAVLVENRVYLPGLAWVGMLTLGYYLWAKRELTWKPAARAVPALVILLHLAILAGMAAQRNHLYSDALLIWDDVAKIYPANGRAHTVLAGLYHERGEDDKAIAHYQRVFEVDQLRPNAHFNLGSIYYQRRQADLAIAEYEKELELRTKMTTKEGFEVKDEAMVEKSLANAYYSQRQYDNAIAHYRKAIELNADYGEAYFELGTLYLDVKDYPGAAEMYERALVLNPHQPSIRNNLGFIYLNTGRPQQALEQFDAALAEDPDDPNAQKNRVRALAALGKATAGAGGQ